MIQAGLLVVDEHKRKHFNTLLWLGISLLPLFAVFDVFHDQWVSAIIELVLAVCFIIAWVLTKFNLYVKQAIYGIMLSILGATLVIMWQDILMVLWVPVVTVIGFGFLGKMGGRQWAVLVVSCVAILLVMDLSREVPLHSLLAAVNIVVSCATVAFIVDYSYQKLKEQQDVLLEETARRERLEVARRFSENMAHLINNEMQVVIGTAEVMMFDMPDGKVKQGLENIIVNADKASRHTNQLSIFAEKNMGVKQEFDFKALVESVVKIWSQKLPANITAITKCEAEVTQCKGDALALDAVMLGILQNAEEAIAADGAASQQGMITVHLSNDTRPQACEVRGLSAGKYIVLSIEDNGCGIPQKLKGKIFEPFVSTGFTGRGMGLATAFGVIKSHDGHIEAVSTKDGSRLDIWLPELTQAAV